MIDKVNILILFWLSTLNWEEDRRWYETNSGNWQRPPRRGWGLNTKLVTVCCHCHLLTPFISGLDCFERNLASLQDELIVGNGMANFWKNCQSLIVTDDLSSFCDFCGKHKRTFNNLVYPFKAFVFLLFAWESWKDSFKHFTFRELYLLCKKLQLAYLC